MTSSNNSQGSIESGIYLIRNIQSYKPLNLTCNEPGAKPTICIWDTLNSHSQHWSVERGERGYLIRNRATSQYISFEHEVAAGGMDVFGGTRKVEWQIEAVDSIYQIKVASSPDIVLDLYGGKTANGSHVFLCGLYGGPNQQWTFQRVEEEPHLSFARQIYVGPVPTGIYWIGQPYEDHKSPDGRSVAMGKAPSTAALSAVARLPLEEGEKGYAHLSAIGNGPWPQQVWQLEPGRHGYRLRNLGINAYLNYVHSEPVLESVIDGLSSVTEWSLWRDPDRDPTDVPDCFIRPSFELSMVIGVIKGDTFNRLRARKMDDWEGKGVIFHQWRFETVEERFLDGSLFPAGTVIGSDPSGVDLPTYVETTRSS